VRIKTPSPSRPPILFPGTVASNIAYGRPNATSDHTYMGTLSGTAFLLGVPVAYTMPNNTSYKYV